MDSKKQLKRQYKESEIPMGIFQIKNLVSGKIFIGSAQNLQGIINRHKAELKFGSHRNKQLQEEWKELGAESFEFSILDKLKPQESDQINYGQELKLLEEMWLDKLSPFGDKGYNTPAKQ